ncbi:VapA/VapB family virulence-associated protein [Prescottella equi]|uniref:Virulence associated protein VapI n=1 Tax=Rhodococcus hoagii TaxID=43767 RepID=Q9ETJ4_RHOHA|nr:VapA/VapB family virulence-associated protein [Prescottella equi]AAG21717.1 unknown [Prescottella equi]ADI50249.1 virulence associated protein VapI [Prescottella equi]BAB16622.1 hypothetical protein [Prescottella equi]
MPIALTAVALPAGMASAQEMGDHAWSGSRAESDVAVLGKAESAHDDPSLRTPKLKKSNSGNQYRYTVLLSSFIFYQTLSI